MYHHFIQQRLYLDSTTVIKGLHNPQIDIKVFSELIKNSLWPSATSIESLIVYNMPATVETEQLIGIKPHKIV